MSEPSKSYDQILRSSSIIGGAQAIHYVLGMVRVKLLAVLLGPVGVGLVGLYAAVTAFVGMAAGLGLGASGVRRIAEAHGARELERTSRVVLSLRRASWTTGVLGWMALAAASLPLSRHVFGSDDETINLTILGATVLSSTLEAGEAAVLQGTRRIGDLARRTVITAVAGTAVSVALYASLGQRGIVPALVATGAITLLGSRWFARNVPLAPVGLTWADTWTESKRLVGLGLAFMWSGLLAAAVALAIRAMIVQDLGIEASGMYQAAWALSGMFAGFILSAMGSDFYPRLTSVASDDVEVNRLVNQQTEIGILLALPGVLGTLAFAPWVMRAFYSSDFAPATALLPWFVVGVFGRVVSWPMGFILLAKGASRWFATVESLFGALHLLLTFVLLRVAGLTGVSIAFAVLYVAYTAATAVLVRWMTGFAWSGSATRLLSISTTLVVASIAAQRWASEVIAVVAGATLTGAALVVSLRGIAARLGAQHRLVRMACKLPGGSVLCGVRVSPEAP